jgi:hypothetical protein
MHWIQCIRFTSKAQQPGGDAEGIALQELALVGDMHLGGEGGAPGHPHMLRRQPDKLIDLVEGLVEGLQIAGDVHMAIDVDPFGRNGHLIADKGCRDDAIWHVGGAKPGLGGKKRARISHGRCFAVNRAGAIYTSTPIDSSGTAGLPSRQWWSVTRGARTSRYVIREVFR